MPYTDKTTLITRLVKAREALTAHESICALCTWNPDACRQGDELRHIEQARNVDASFGSEY